MTSTPHQSCPTMTQFTTASAVASASLKRGRRCVTDTGPHRSSLLEHNRRTHGDYGRDLFRACTCDAVAERTGGWTPWTTLGRAGAPLAGVLKRA
eukprot:6834472-Prymnesium_polylepis.1